MCNIYDEEEKAFLVITDKDPDTGEYYEETFYIPSKDAFLIAQYSKTALVLIGSHRYRFKEGEPELQISR